MYTLVDLPVARTMRAMSALAAHRVLRDAGSHLEFANDYLRGQCYVTMAAPMRRMLHSLVADRLLAEDGADQPIPGLEVAWHLVRGDRLPEAVPYLLAGGRESIRRGAPHEADLALSTGMPALTGAPRRTAILLWTEALQELGRWADSLRAMDTPCDPYDASEECCREVLRVIGRRWVGSMTVKEMMESTSRLCAIAALPIDVEVRVKALSAVPYLLTQTRDAEGLKVLGEALAIIDRCSMDSYQQLHFLMAQSWWHDQRRETTEAVRLVEEGVDLIDKTSFASSIAVRLMVGSGVLALQSGQYAAAIPKLERATRMAKKIDNMVHHSSAAAGLAMAYGRQGNFNEQMDWARHALKFMKPDEWGIVALSACYEFALASVMVGQEAEAIAHMQAHEIRFGPGRPDWAVQAWRLMKADILWMGGQQRRAMNCAKKGLAISPQAPIVMDFSGLHARWTAITARHDREPERAIPVIQSCLERGDQLHAKDRAEVMASMAIAYAAMGADSLDAERQTVNQLRKLPPTIAILLRRLGVLPSEGSQAGKWGTK
jgi:tetratricopeptide (TPR) repeat protein